MTKNFNELRKQTRTTPERRARVAQFKAAMEDAVRLAELREQRTASQELLAANLAVSQARISQIEHAGDWYLSTISSYVAALGGRLRITAEFDDESFDIATSSASGPANGSEPIDGVR